MAFGETIDANAGRNQHLLVVDDDTRIRDLLVSYLFENGFAVSSAQDTKQAREKMRALVFDLIILDIMMPGESGLELSRDLREHNNNVPILFLSALSDTEDKIKGLMAGGDDYLAKPFEPRELLLRIASILRRQPEINEKPESVSFGPYNFHLQRGELRKDEIVVHLTTREKEMLGALAENAGEVVSRADLSSSQELANTRGVDVQITRLRGKIEKNPSLPVYLQTVRAKGYVLLTD